MDEPGSTVRELDGDPLTSTRTKRRLLNFYPSQILSLRARKQGLKVLIKVSYNRYNATF